MMREVIQLARALIDPRLELQLMHANGVLRLLQLFGHLIERFRQRVQLAHATARDASSHGAAGQSTGRFSQASHRRSHACNGDKRNDDQQKQSRDAGPSQLTVSAIRCMHRQSICISKRAPRRLDQLRHDHAGDLRGLIAEHHRLLVEGLDAIESSTTPGDHRIEVCLDLIDPGLAMQLDQLG